MTAPGELITLRAYQSESIDATFAGWNRGVRRPVVVLPTGAGKTVVFAHLIAKFLRENPHKRVLVLAHRDELVTQGAQEIKGIAPHLPVGILKGARDDVWAAVVVASVQSLRTEARRARLRDVGLIIVDECHHATAKTYRDILEYFGAFDPNSDLRVLGVTATLARTDGASLGEIWQEVVYQRDILFMINNNDNGPCAPGQGYLLDIKGISVEIPDLDLDSVKRSRGDFQDGDLGRAMTESLAPELVAQAYKEHAATDAGMAFWPTVEAAYIGAEAMNEIGIVTEVVHGKLSTTERRNIIGRANAGETQVLSNCMVLTEGFNWRKARVLALARPTQSVPLFQQMAGRVLRPYPGQTEALLLDTVGAARTNHLCTLADLTDKEIKEVREGQTLSEAIAELEEIALAPYQGPVTFEEVDLFAQARKSKRVWMQSRGGTFFLAWGTQRYLFLVPTTVPDAPMDTWDVAWCTKSAPWTMPDGTQRYGGFTEHRAMDFGYAMKWAEDMVNQLDGDDFGQKGASWRKRPASERQINFARSLGCQVTEGMTGNEVSLAIDIAQASPRVDHYVGKIFEMAAK